MRAEGDSWDIVSSVGATALGIAAARAMETAKPDPLVRDEYAALFVRASGHERMIAMLDGPAAQDDWLLGSGMIGLRTKFYDNHFLSADGIRQAVILAAGLDARAFASHDGPEHEAGERTWFARITHFGDRGTDLP